MKPILLFLLLLEILDVVSGFELFGRRRQTGSRRRTGARHATNVSYGLSNTIWYVILGFGVLFVIALIAGIVYRCVVVRKRDQNKRDERKYKSVGGGFDARSKAEKNKEMEMYLAEKQINPLSPQYRDFQPRQMPPQEELKF